MLQYFCSLLNLVRLKETFNFVATNCSQMTQIYYLSVSYHLNLLVDTKFGCFKLQTVKSTAIPLTDIQVKILHCLF